MIVSDLFLYAGVVLATAVFFILEVVQSALSSAALQDLEDDDQFSLHSLILAVRQEGSREYYAVVLCEWLFGLLSAACIALAIVHSGIPDSTIVLSILAACGLLSGIRSVLSAIASRFSEQLLTFSLFVLRVCVIASFPMNALVEFVHTKISGQQSDEEAREEMQEEITAIMDEAIQEGTLDADEYRILTNIMQFSEVTVKDVMTPRSVVFHLSADTLIRDVVDRPELMTYSRIPLCEEQSLDAVLGYCLTRDIYSSALHGGTEKALSNLIRDVHFIPENVRLDKALEEFLTRRQHLFIVVDEYGGVEGLITMEDVVETILGAEIVDEADRVEDLRQLASSRRDQRIAAARQSTGHPSPNSDDASNNKPPLSTL